MQAEEPGCVEAVGETGSFLGCSASPAAFWEPVSVLCEVALFLVHPCHSVTLDLMYIASVTA